MHAPHKTCNFRFIKSKERGEKSKQRRVKERRGICREGGGILCREGGAKRDMQRKEREGYAEKGKGGINGGRDMQRRGG